MSRDTPLARGYTLRFFKLTVPDPETGIDHTELGAYELEHAPWVPREGEFIRFRDPYPPNKPYDHNEVAGYIKNVVSVWYGTSMTIEVYIRPRDGF